MSILPSASEPGLAIHPQGSLVGRYFFVEVRGVVDVPAGLAASGSKLDQAFAVPTIGNKAEL